MCGIVSIISRRNNGFFGADLELFENLLVLDTLRGLDSTGVFSVDHSRNVSYMKVASHPFHLFACEEWKKWRGKAVSSGRILVGHNRKATQGSINSANAHPFHENNIILVHNGTLRGDHKKIADTEVDSHALCHAFNEKGAEAVLPTINGAFALMWWDIEKSRLFAIRNDERPLSIVVTDECYIVLSESWMALQLLAKAGKKVTDVIDIKPGMLYEFAIGGEFKTKEVEVQTDYWTTTTTTNYTGNRVRNGVYQHGGAANASSVTPPKPGEKDGGQAGGGGCQSPFPTTSTTSPSGNQSETSRSSTAGKDGVTTALTLVKNTGSGSQQQGGDTGEEIPPIDPSTGHINCTDYPKHAEVLVKYYEMKLSQNKAFYFCRGKTIEPGQEEIDVVTYMPQSLFKVAGEQIQYLNKPVLATVVKHTNSVCGRSLYVNKSHLPDVVDVHNAKITVHEWNYIITRCKCAKCEAKIYDEERQFTSVNRKPGNKYKITCADCVEDSLIGEFKYVFNQDRLATVQAHLAERNQAGVNTDNGAGSAGTTTVH